MFKKILLNIISFVTLLLISLILFGGILKYSYNGGKKLIPLQKVANFIAGIPDILRPSNIKNYFVKSEELLAESERHFKKEKFKRFIPSIERDELLLLARYDGDLRRSIVEVVDLNTFNIIHFYTPDINYINSKVDKEKEEFKNQLIDHHVSRHQMVHPLLLRDGELLFNSGPLIKVDFCGNLLWLNDEDEFGHANEIDNDGNYWVKTKMFPYALDKKLVGDEHGEFDDDAITKVSPDGEIIYQKSVSQILFENGLFGQVFGRYRYFLEDPIHLNDIQPVLADGPYWKKGDLFLSSNVLSAIIHYRPETNQVVNYILGPFSQQHDVDIISDNEISMFNNNSYNIVSGKKVLTNSNILIYNLETKKFSERFKETIVANNLVSKSQGVNDFLSDGSLMVEEQNHGRILFFNSEGKLEWEYVNKAKNGKVYLLTWSRIINDKNLIENFKNKLKSTKCSN